MQLYNLLTEKQIFDFLMFLEGPECCNFREENDQTVWTCFGDHRFANIWLKRNKISFESIYWAREHFCDCEIVLNAPFVYEEEEE